MNDYSPSSLADIERLEKENRELKRSVGATNSGKELLRNIRGITLRKENELLRELAKFARTRGLTI